MGLRSGSRTRLFQRRARRPLNPLYRPIEPLEPRTLLSFAPLGPEFRVNTTTLAPQGSPAVAADADGDFVVAWAGFGPGDQSGIFAQRYAATGAPLGGEFLVNTTTADTQALPAVAADADGDFVIAWAGPDGSDSGVFARRFSAAGAPLGDEFVVANLAGGAQTTPSVAMDAAGDFVIGWNGAGGLDNDGVFARRFNSAGLPLGEQFTVNTTTLAEQRENSVAMDAAGNFVVVWNSNGQDGSGFGVYGQRYNAAGVRQGAEFRVNTTTLSDQFCSGTVAMNAAGDFVVPFFIHQVPFDVGTDVYMQRYNAAGVPQGGETLVNTSLPDNQFAASALADAGGNFIVTWQSNAQDGSGFGVYAQRYNAAGVAQGTEFRVNSTTARDQQAPALALDADGDAVIAWQSDQQDGSFTGVYAQRYAETADAAGPMPTSVAIRGAPVFGGQEVSAPVQSILVNFSERMSTAGGATGANSITNPANWGLGKDGDDISSSIRSVSFGFNEATRKYEAVLLLSPQLLDGDYTLALFSNVRDVAGNALDGDLNGTSGGTFFFGFGVSSDPPTTIGIPPMTVAEDEADVVVNLFDAFDDATDADAALLYQVVGNSNPALFDATTIDGQAGTLTLGLAPNANGAAEVTVRATDTGGAFVDSTFTVTVVPVNDPPVNTVPAVQVARPGQPVTFSKDLGNAISVSDVDDPSEKVMVTIEKPLNLTLAVKNKDKVDVKTIRGGIQISGAIPDVNLALEGLQATQVNKGEEQDTLVITTNDQGSVGLGGPMTDSDVIPIVFASAPLVLSVGDVSEAEGDGGTTVATFVVRLSGRVPTPVTVHYATADGSATVAGEDYQPAQGDLTFSGVTTEQTVSVLVNGDFDVEGDEQFFLNLSNATGGALIGDPQGIGTIVNDDLLRPPPVVTAVFVGGSAWSAGFKSFLQARSLGDATFGYSVPAGAAQLDVLPWANLDQVSVRFDHDVLALDPDLAVRGVRVPSYAIASFDYDQPTHTATWTLAQPLGSDKVLLDLNGGPDGIVDGAAQALDGEWANGSSAFPSGNGTAGGNLRFRLNVLPGDSTRDGRVNGFDFFEMLRRRPRTAANPGSGTLQYTPFYDLNGDGLIGITDLLTVRRNLLRGLPAAEPATALAAAAPPSVTRELFATQPLA